MDNLTEFLNELKLKLHKAITHLAYSYRKLEILPMQASQLDEENFEVW